MCVCVLVSEREIKEDSDEMILLLLVSAPRENRQWGGVGCSTPPNLCTGVSPWEGSTSSVSNYMCDCTF